jgi:trigger factor
LKVELKQLENWKRSLTVEVPVEDVQRHIDQLVQQYQRRMSLPGFRKGKAPGSLVRSSLSETIDQEVLDRLVPEAFEEALKQVGLESALHPRVEDLHYHAGEPLRFTALFEVRPDLTPRDYKGLSLSQETFEVADADVARVVEDLRQRAAEYPPTEAEAGDASLVVVDYVAKGEDGQLLPDGRRHNYPLELGAAGLLPEFREGLLGAKAGESRTLNVPYAPDFRNQDLAGKNVRYEMKIKEVREKKLPELDDTFARERFGARDLEDLRSRVRLRLEGEEHLAARERLEASLVEEVVKRNEFTPPESMVEGILDRLSERAREEDKEVPDEEIARLRVAYRAAAERTVKRDLLWEAIARDEKLEVPQDELDAEIRRIVESGAAEAAAGQRAPDEATLRSPRNLERIRGALLDRKVYEFLIQAAEVKTATRPRPQAPPAA